jgi:hypothetical protein
MCQKLPVTSGCFRPKAASGELGGKRPTHLKVEHIRGRQLTVYDDVRRFAQAR